ncbi:sugar kinase (plasmid) [Streptomyces sp. NBC_00841]|uniref:sugar kinase n=1 Tax=unclassified Streptomyces TaxID=2593676 RepID=UPI0022568BD5|nr:MULTISPECIES: sugar kinase [unclassified Streptomyces]MCX4538833.1 sugar kinase [Streptomyces sp. NBC_01669]WSA05372.1 sugar kinase [Streptomyces sp. NBC_00841]
MTAATAPEVVTVGETMATLRATGPIRLAPLMETSVAGAESNVAIGLARLGHRVAWAGCVGDDEFGALVLRTLRAEGVDTGHVRTDSEGRPTGLLIREDGAGDLAKVRYYRAGSAGSAVGPQDVLRALGPGTCILHLTGITPALGPSAARTVQAAADRARELGVTVCLDVNYRARLWSPDQARAALRPLARAADILVASDDELHLVAPDPALGETDAVAALLAEGLSEVVLTRGGEGASVTDASGTFDAAARKVPVKDVIGAGDAFVAGYLSARLDGLPAAEGIRRAVALGAFGVATRGDWEGLPTRAELALLDAPAGTTLR